MRLILTAFLLLSALVTTNPADALEERVVLPGGAELFLMRPDKPGPWPIMLFLHGHQSPPRPGARVFLKLDQRPRLATVDEGRLAHMQDRGYLAAAVSLPGYGATPGPADFWGPRSQAVLQEALDYLLAQPNVDQDHVGVYGVSGGAATASMQATRDGRIKALILAAGVYDLGEAYPSGDPGLDDYIRREAGTTPESFASRAALRYADKIRAHTLILHGEKDDRGGTVHQARRLADRLRNHRTPVRIRIYEGTPHSIPMNLQWQEIDPFLKQFFGR